MFGTRNQARRRSADGALEDDVNNSVTASDLNGGGKAIVLKCVVYISRKKG